ncbi:MAG: divergent PAP2 family protein [Clostridium sp.]|nr:divergent PAP2 family protein [Clostridium sp.]MCM1444289.1 divergent PAP2 family protein [Candidatus Amulumruptor caecigallinarius]
MSLNNYKFIIIPILTLLICQIIKFSIESIKSNKLKWGRLFNGSGGMPSSHTSFATSLTTLIGINIGVESPLFAIGLVFTLIIAYDSMGLRMQSGKQAQAINLIVDELFENDIKFNFRKLKEQLGHQPLEVLGGIILGICSSIILDLMF